MHWAMGIKMITAMTGMYPEKSLGFWFQMVFHWFWAYF